VPQEEYCLYEPFSLYERFIANFRGNASETRENLLCRNALVARVITWPNQPPPPRWIASREGPLAYHASLCSRLAL
jgi:hypothetical protein